MALVGALAVLALTACDFVVDPRLDQLVGTGPFGAVATVERDLAYGTALGCDGNDAFCGGSQELDVHLAAPLSSDGPPARHGVLVWLHGGGWSGGDKASDVPANVLRQLDRGWDVVSVNYRLSPGVTFPGPLLDAKLAIRWVKVNADHYGWDLDRLVVTGYSAGGNLAAMVAVTNGVPTLEPAPSGALAAVDSSVAAAVSINGVLDLNDAARRNAFGHAIVNGYVGCTACGAADLASPGWWVDSGDAPLYLVQGKDDPWAPSKQALDLCIAGRLRSLPCRMDLVDTGPIEGRGHDSGPSLNQSALEAFLDRATLQR